MMFRRSVLYALPAASFVLGLAGCDPCAGTAACGTTSPRVVMEGEIVHTVDGRGVDDVELDVIPTGGSVTPGDTLHVRTSGGGFWRAEFPATGTGDAIFNVLVHAPSLAHPYTVQALHVAPVTHANDAVELPRWNAELYFPYYFDFFLRPTGDFVASTGVTYRITGGPKLTGPIVSGDDVFTGTDPIAGRAQFFLYNAFATDTGTVTGDVIVDLPAPYGPSITHRLTLKPSYIFRDGTPVGRLGVGPSLEYAAQIFDRATARPLPNIPVTLHRTGGIGLAEPDESYTTDANGVVHFHPKAQATGKLLADIVIQPPHGNPETRHDTIPTFDADSGVFLGNWTAGAVLPYFGLVRSFGINLVGVPVRVRRTAGIDVQPADTVITTNEFGGINISPRPQAAGSVTFELTFTPPAPYPRFMVSNLVLSTVQRDVPQGINIFIWDLDTGIHGPPGTTVTVLP